MRKKRRFGEIHNEYKKFKKEDKEIKRLYNQIKIEYLEEENLNIYLEKIYLEKKMNGEKSKTHELNYNIILGMMTTIMAVIIEKFIVPNDGVNIFIVFMFSVLVFSIIDKNEIRKEYNEYLYYKICLMVIEEIEKERTLK